MLPSVADPGGANPAMVPPSKLEMEFDPPSEAERVMIALWICLKVMILAPRIAVGYGFGPLRKKYHIKTLKKVDD